MFEELQENLQAAFKGLQGQKTISEENVDNAIREVKRALINSDVSLKAVKTFTSKVREKAIGQEVTKGIAAEDQFIKIVNDELVELLGNEQKELNISSENKPNIILALGLQGAGKTTSCGKLAKLLKKKGHNPLLVPLDLKRPAAIEQLTILGEQAEVSVFKTSEQNKALEVAKKSITYAKENNHDVVILDSAGRLQIDNELMAELLLIEKILKPQEKLLVIDSMIGQEAANVAAAFDMQIGVTGILLTKLDGDAKGGAALSIVEEINKPIKLVGIGEKLDDLQEFHPNRVVSRILGMGDVLTLVEKAQENIEENEAKAFEEKMLKGDFNFDTFLQAQNMVGKFGNFGSMFDMMGMGNLMNKMGGNISRDNKHKMLAEGENKMKKFKIAIQSMTNEERLKPNILNMNRKLRIAKGCGQKEKDIDQLVKEFSVMKKIMDKMKPLMGMMKGGRSMNPADMLGGLLGSGGMQQSSGNSNRAARRMSKGFNPKKHR